MNLTVAVMQPYFFPYLGYFSLFSRADIFVVYDNVQFPKEGWVHRNKLRKHNGELGWLTLPIRKCPLKTRINELDFNLELKEYFINSFGKFASLSKNNSFVTEWKDVIMRLDSKPVDYLVSNLERVCNYLDITFNVVYASDLDLNFNINAQDRVIEICKKVGATEYLNLPGGRDLYQHEAFASNGIKLSFLPNYEGEYVSCLQRILDEPRTNLINEFKMF